MNKISVVALLVLFNLTNAFADTGTSDVEMKSDGALILKVEGDSAQKIYESLADIPSYDAFVKDPLNQSHSKTKGQLECSHFYNRDFFSCTIQIDKSGKVLN